MFELVLKNSKGESLTFSPMGDFTLIDTQGLNPPNATINTNETALGDGVTFNSAKVNPRTINLAFTINRNSEANRLQVYKVLKSKQGVDVFYTSQYRDIYIHGIVESIEVAYWENPQTITLSIFCPAPFFKEAQELVNRLENTIGMFKFPFAIAKSKPIPFSRFDQFKDVTIVNHGDITCGLKIELYAYARVINPKIFNYITNEFIGIQYTLEPADAIVIHTSQGEKTILLIRNGKEINLFNSLMRGSTWLQLETGENTFVAEADDDTQVNLGVTFYHSQLYEGV
ncbi:MAG: phage distal tail protein [Beduini sp.]|uniref:phage distal tail protein n=1 Tax=Beduini sp. TaxID=1922300 RepID=UPI0039A2522F